MAKKIQRVEENSTERALKWLMLGCALIYSALRMVMSVAWRMLYDATVWNTIQQVMGYATVSAGALYGVFYMARRNEEHGLVKSMLRKVPVELWLFAGMMAWSMFSCASVQSTYSQYDWWSMNSTLFFDFFADVLILFPVGMYLKRNWDGKWLIWAARALVLLGAVPFAFVVYKVFSNEVIYLSNGGGIGIDGHLALIINCNRNTTGIWGMLGMYMSLALLYTDKKWWKIPCALATVVYLMITVLSQSRTCILGVVLMMGLTVFAWFIKQKRIVLPKTWQQWLAGIGAAAVVMGVTYLLCNWLYQFYLNVSRIQELLGMDEALNRFEGQSLSDLSGRGVLWQGALNAIVYDARSFFFGITPAGVPSWISDQNMYTHNEFLEIAVAFGVPALLLYFGIIWKQIRQTFRMCVGEHTFAEILVPVGVFLLLVTNMMEATLIAYNFLSGHLYFILCGWMAAQRLSMKNRTL